MKSIDNSIGGIREILANELGHVSGGCNAATGDGCAARAISLWVNGSKSFYKNLDGKVYKKNIG